jgi:hypothetical protein
MTRKSNLEWNEVRIKKVKHVCLRKTKIGKHYYTVEIYCIYEPLSLQLAYFKTDDKDRKMCNELGEFSIVDASDDRLYYIILYENVGITVNDELQAPAMYD